MTKWCIWRICFVSLSATNLNCSYRALPATSRQIENLKWVFTLHTALIYLQWWGGKIVNTSAVGCWDWPGNAFYAFINNSDYFKCQCLWKLLCWCVVFTELIFVSLWSLCCCYYHYFIFIFLFLLMLYLSISFCNNISLWMSWLLVVL